MAYKIRAIIKRPDEPFGHMTNISNTLANLQNTVGGYIETITIRDGLVIVCNEEGKLKGLAPNFRIPGDEIVGTVIICGEKPGEDGDEFCDIPIEFAEWKEYLKRWREA